MKKVLVIGAALSGCAVSRLLVKKGYDVVLTDMKKVPESYELENLGISVYDEGHPEFLKSFEYEFIVKNPGIPYHVPFVKHFVEKNVPIYNEIEVALWYGKNLQVGAVTGTNGKTTTTTLLGELLKRKRANAETAGNIGRPLSDLVIEDEETEKDIAMEIAAFQLVACPAFHPVVSVCMNLTPDHLDYFKDLNKYYEAKMLVHKNQTEQDWFLRNIDDPEIMKLTNNLSCKVVDFSMEKEADLCVKDGNVMLYDEVLFSVADCHLPGKHNLQNCMVAACMAYRMGVSLDDIRAGISEFKGVEHRLEYVETIHDVRYYNDSKGTNTDATITALKSFDQSVILIAGGYDKKTGFEELRPYLDKIKLMVVYGETKLQLKRLMPSAIVCDNLTDAVEVVFDKAQKGDVVLFSPVCASWDQFKNFEERGRLFKELVRNHLD